MMTKHFLYVWWTYGLTVKVQTAGATITVRRCIALPALSIQLLSSSGTAELTATFPSKYLLTLCIPTSGIH